MYISIDETATSLCTFYLNAQKDCIYTRAGVYRLVAPAKIGSSYCRKVFSASHRPNARFKYVADRKGRCGFVCQGLVYCDWKWKRRRGFFGKLGVGGYLILKQTATREFSRFVMKHVTRASRSVGRFFFFREYGIHFFFFLIQIC